MKTKSNKANEAKKPSCRKTHLRLTIDLTYDDQLTGEELDLAKEQLGTCLGHLADNGMLTDDTNDLELDSWRGKVEEVTA